MTKKSKEQILREIETAIQRLDKEGLPDSEIIDILAAKGVPADRAKRCSSNGVLNGATACWEVGLGRCCLAARSW
jgi:hypothetical protein